MISAIEKRVLTTFKRFSLYVAQKQFNRRCGTANGVARIAYNVCNSNIPSFKIGRALSFGRNI